MILNKSPGLLWGAGGAMMAWELAQARFHRQDGYGPVERALVDRYPYSYPVSAEFYRIIDRAEAAAANRETLTWANGHNTVRL